MAIGFVVFDQPEDRHPASESIKGLESGSGDNQKLISHAPSWKEVDPFRATRALARIKQMKERTKKPQEQLVISIARCKDERSRSKE